MKKSIVIKFEETKLSALKMYLEQKQMSLEGELEKGLEGLYQKIVPVGVREYISLQSTVGKTAERKKGVSSSAVERKGTSTSS